MQKSACPACYPNKVYSHRSIYWGDFLDMALGGMLGGPVKSQLPRFPKWLSLTHYFYKIMAMFRIVQFTVDFKRQDHYPRSFAIIEEARRRGIPIAGICILGRTTSYYRAIFGSKRYYFDAVPSRFLNLRLDEKDYAKKQLLKHGFPAPEGRKFRSILHAMHYGKKLGFPLAVKPAHGTHAYHVTAPVNNVEELRNALALAKQYQPRFIVEKYLAGELYRVTVINFNKVFVARRVAPNVAGNGKDDIRALIIAKNADLRRGETGQRDTTLHKIPMPSPLLRGEGDRRSGEGATTDVALARAGLAPDYVPKQGEKIILHSKTSIGSGGDIIEETPLLHPENREMFRRAARLCGADLVGFDVIAEDLAQPYHLQTVCGIIEANSIPMLDFHHYPYTGESQNAAGALWDGIIADRRVRYLYPVMLPQRSLGTRVTWHLLDIFMPHVRDFMLRFRIVRRLLRRQRFAAGYLRPEATPEAAIAHLKMQGFEVVRPEWIDQGEIMGLRKLLDHEKQCHIRFFDDGEVRAHIEYAPEARPIAHLVEQGFQDAADLVQKFLPGFIVARPDVN